MSEPDRRGHQQDGDYLFKGRVEGRPIVKVNAAHTAAVDRSGVSHFTLYALRHTYATRAAMAGVDAITLARVAWSFQDYSRDALRTSKPAKQDGRNAEN